jgi:hypothetical protein
VQHSSEQMYITRGTQPERRVLRLECLCYNKWHPGPKLSASLRLRIEASLVCFKTLLDLPKYCLHIIHFKPCVLLGSHRSSSHIIVVSQVPSCNPFYGLLVLVHHQSLMSTLHGVGHLRVMSFWSRTWHQEPFCLSYLRKHHFQSLRCDFTCAF